MKRMGIYWYRGLDGQGRTVWGKLAADSQQQAVEMLKQQGRFATQLYGQKWALPLRGKRLAIGDLEPFCQQLALLLHSGLSLLSALELIKKERLSPTMARWLQQVTERIRTGEPLTVALAQSEMRLPPLLVELTAVGEQHGRLGETLQQAAEQFASKRQLKNELLTALLYPMLVLGIMVLAVIAMLIFVVPSLVQTYQSLDAPLPWLTRRLIAISDFILRYGIEVALVLIAGGVGTVIVFYSLRTKPPWPVIWRRVAQRLPFIYGWWAQRYFVQFAQMLGQLLQGGVLLLEALQMVNRHYRGILYRQELQDLLTQALCGCSLTEGLAGCSFIPPAALQMIHIGEESGHLAEMLLHSSAYYSKRLTEQLNRFVRLLEPFLIVLLGMLVLLMAGSLFWPIIAVYRYIG